MSNKIFFKVKHLWPTMRSGRSCLHLAPPFLVEDYTPKAVIAHREGWLKNRVEEAIEELKNCKACPRDCGVNRLENKTGACNTGNTMATPLYSSYGKIDCCSLDGTSLSEINIS